MDLCGLSLHNDDSRKRVVYHRPSRIDAMLQLGLGRQFEQGAL